MSTTVQFRKAQGGPRDGRWMAVCHEEGVAFEVEASAALQTALDEAALSAIATMGDSPRVQAQRLARDEEQREQAARQAEHLAWKAEQEAASHRAEAERAAAEAASRRSTS